jgi:hypothetical protein
LGRRAAFTVVMELVDGRDQSEIIAEAAAASGQPATADRRDRVAFTP